MNNFPLPNWYGKYQNFIDSAINTYLEEYFKDKDSAPVENFKEIIFYSVKGGKRVRSILALERYLSLSGKKIEDIDLTSDITKFCIALELVHAYSLIHDDLPCMDNDELRRGEPTVWKKYGESNAVLAGDLLNSLCFECLSEISSANLSQKLIKLLSHSVGIYGMIGGQIDDLFYEKNSRDLDETILKNLHNKKTGNLIEASLLGGMYISEKNETKELISSLGKQLGLAFQIKDDLLDVEGSAEETGKSVGDEEKGFVHFLGIDKTKDELNRLINNCKNICQEIDAPKLLFIVEYVATRKK